MFALTHVRLKKKPLEKWLPIFILTCGLALGATCIGPITPPAINQAPIADAGENQILCAGQTVRLSALASTDPDGDTLSYIWTRTLAPAPDDLDNNLIPEPRFTPSVAGAYEFSLTVTDDRGGSDSDTVRVVSVAPAECDRCQNGQCCLDADCDDGLFCNGAETCTDGACRTAASPCGPEEECVEATDQCRLPGAPLCRVQADCDDGRFCNGAEFCVGGACQAGIGPCPGRLCREADDRCVDCLTNDDCDDGVFCNGSETCNSNGSCEIGSPPCPDDGRFCNGTESCDEPSDRCVSFGNPCESGETCNEDTNDCAPGCTTACVTNADCADDRFCNGIESCINGCCVSGAVPCAQGQVCCEDSDLCAQCCSNADCPGGQTCNRSIARCQGGGSPCTDDSTCDDGQFCNGAEFCADGECHNCVSPCTSGQVCDENAEQCSPNGAPGDTFHSAETVTESINPAGDTDPFTFTAEAGDTVVIKVSSDFLRPCIDLFAPSGGSPEASVCNEESPWHYGSIYRAFLQGHQLLESGRYTIVVRVERGDSTGEYSLSLVVISSQVDGSICSGQTVTESIDPAANLDARAFSGVAGNSVVIQMSSEFLFPCIDLFAPSGGSPEASVCVHYSPSYTYYNVLLQGHRLLESGQYTIVARDGRGNDTGEYSLSLVVIP